MVRPTRLRASPARYIWLVFVLFACLYLLSIGRGFNSSDGDVMLKTTASLVERHSFALAPDPGLPQIVLGQNGHHYSKYDPGLPLIGIPFYAAGDWIARTNHAHRYRVTTLFYLMIPALSAAATLAALAAFTSRQPALRSTIMGEGAASSAPTNSPLSSRWGGGQGVRSASVAILAAALATPLWVYARTLYAEATLACALTWAVYGVGRVGQALPLRRERLTLFLAGLVFGSGLLTRAALAIYLPALAVVVIRHAPDRQRRARAVRLGSFAAGVLPGVLLLLGHNMLRFGVPLRFGYAGESFTTAPWKGIIGLLLSPGKGVFLYAPPLILCVVLWRRFRRMNPALGDFLALAWGAALAFYGSWWAWDGGWCWGPRFLVPLIPLSCLPLMALPNRLRWRAAAGVLILAGTGVQAGGVLTDIIPHYAQISAGKAADIDRVNFSLEESPLAESIRRVTRGQTEPLGLFHLDDTGLPSTWTVGVPALLIVGVFVGAWRLIRAGTGRTDSRPRIPS